MSNLLEIDAVDAGWGDGPEVLHDVSFSVQAGEFVSLLGPSGCGKSTVLNLVAGLLRPRSGSVQYDGRVLSSTNTDVGYMTQGDTLLPWLSVYDNVAVPLQLRKVSKSETRRRVAELLNLMDLGAAAKKYPSQLSGGMKRRALLARSMIYEPKLLLMDEPFAALDAQLRAQMHEELLKNVSRTGQAVVFITHDILEAVLLSDRVLVVGGSPGRIMREVHIPFGKDRRLTEVRFTPEFTALEQEVTELLNSARAQMAHTVMESAE